MKIKNLSLLIIIIWIFGCTITTETERDPSKKGYILAEQMVQKGRYHAGLLLHKVNAEFFSGYYYAKKSASRIEQLNELLKKSTKGRPPVEITKNVFITKKNKPYLLFTVVNNTDKKITNLSFRAQFLDKRGRALRNPKTRQRFYVIRQKKSLGSWDMADIYFPITDFNVKNLKEAVIKPSEGYFENNKPVDFNSVME